MTKKIHDITCSDIDALLSLDGVDVKPDKVAISAHLSNCVHCQEKAPELSWFYGQLSEVDSKIPETSKRPFRWTRVACAAVLVMAATSLFLVDRGFGSEGEVEVDVAEDVPLTLPSRILPEHYSTVEFGRTHISANQAVSTTSVGAFGSLGSRGDSPHGEMEWIR